MKRTKDGKSFYNFVPKIIDLLKDALLLKIFFEGDYRYLLSWMDRGRVRDIFKYLLRHENCGVFLEGGVVQNRLKGIKGYSDVDIVVVVNTSEMEIFHFINAARLKNRPLKIGRSLFRVRLQFPKQRNYMGFFNVLSTLTLFPLCWWDRFIPINRWKSKPIDITFINKDDFEKEAQI